jgi:two-component system, cell cycle sensor histidine kinase DivJ
MLMSCRLSTKEMIMKSVQDDVVSVTMSLPYTPAVPRSRGRSTPAAMHDDAPLQGIQSPVIAQATREAGSTLYELLGMVELLRVAYEKGELESTQSRLEIILLQAGALSSTLSTIIDFSRKGFKPSEAAGQFFDIVALLQEVSLAARPLVQGKPIKVMDAACATPLIINSDPDKIRRIMTGLMSNAATFTDRGRIAMILNKDKDEVRLTIADTGRGMAQGQIDAVLSSSDPENDIEKNAPLPLGQGLRIINKLIKQLRGSLSIASKTGEGTIVTVSLPLKSSS